MLWLVTETGGGEVEDEMWRATFGDTTTPPAEAHRELWFYIRVVPAEGEN